MNREISEMNREISEMKGEVVKQGLQTAENSRAILKLAEEIRLVAELEVTVLKNSGVN